MWKTAKLGDVCEIQPKKAQVKKKLSDNDEVSFLPMDSLGINTMYPTPTQTKILEKAYSSYTYFEENDVLLAKITPCFENGKLGIARNLVNGVGFGSSEYIVLRCTDGILPQFLYHQLNQNSFRNDGKLQMTGAVGHKRVPKGYVENTVIQLPPLAEQQRIVEKLDAAFAEIDKAIQATDTNVWNANKLLSQSVLTIIARNSSDVISAPLGDVLKVSSGKFLPKKKMNEGGSIKVFGGNGVAGMHDEHNLEGQNIVIGRVGAKCGNVHFVSENIWLTDNAMFAHSFKYDFSLEFLWLVLSLRNLGDYARQAAQPVISFSSIKDIEISFPKSLDEQENIIDKVNELDGSCNSLFRKYQQKIDTYSTLKSAILAQELQSKAA